jgi:FAD/FMN-containing dehydrogenase
MQQAVDLTSAVNRVSSALAALERVAGTASVVTDPDERRFFAHDVYRAGELPAAILRPASTEALVEGLRALAPFGLPVVPRGGGMSYTDGYIPACADAVMIDLQRLDRVVAINPEDGYVTVECGITWKALDDALAPHGMRTPYWGPLSGLRSTVGGALSQGSIFLGSGRYGPVAESVLGLDVMLVDGTVLRLGSHANGRGAPFFRQFGPDTMGMFLSDTGALGIKTRATFRLIRRPAEARYLSFEYATARELLTAMAAVAREDVVSECFAFDPGLQAVRLRRSSLGSDVRTLGKVMKAAGGGLSGLKEGAKLVAAGRGFLGADTFSMHVSLDGRDATDADARAAIVRGAAARGGREVENSIPKVMRAQPFAEVNSMLGPNGERWVPVHGIGPFSRAVALYESCEAVFARHAGAIARHDIDRGYLVATVGLAGILIEPVLYWPDAPNAFHERVLAADYLAKLPTWPPNPAAAAAVAALREALAVNFMEQGAASFQIGRFYRYQDGLDASAAQLLAQLKALVDPRGRMNPGSLGLAR